VLEGGGTTGISHYLNILMTALSAYELVELFVISAYHCFVDWFRWNWVKDYACGKT
jgi:hypothetical protein